MSENDSNGNDPPGPSLEKLRVFVDADVLFAGAASPSEQSASQVVLQLAEISLIDAVTSEQAVSEAERNLQAKLPEALEAFRLITSRALRILEDPTPEATKRHAGRAAPKDLPLLTAALQGACPYLVTYNMADYRPGHPAVEVLTAGAFVRAARDRLSRL